MKELREVNVRLQEKMYSNELKNPEAFSKIISCNKRMLSVFHYCEAVAATRQPVLITGETGVGKELFAGVIHKLSKLSGNFLPVNISGFDDNMLSDTLFGHCKGAFTGAIDNRSGIIEKASGGTLFLDEIGDLSLTSQVKLLRLLQEGEYSPLGSDTVKISDARVVLATNRDLWKLQQDSNFRKDLYYRISTHHIQIPPLRDRKDDIKLLLDHFIIKASKEMNKVPPSYHPELITRLKSYHYPGNIRELEGMVYDALSNHKSKMLSMDIFINHIERNSREQYDMLPEKKESISELFSDLVELPTLKSSSDTLVDEAIKRSEGNQSIAAKILGISPQALSARLKKRQ
jgi:transcriptional regulator with PAS, ATPase and Fis domain